MAKFRGVLMLGALGCVAAGAAQAQAPQRFDWATVVNNLDFVPGTARNFNSYNQPGVNSAGVVVFRARSRGGQSGGPARGIFTRDISMGDVPASPIETVAAGTMLVPAPNDLNATFNEFPSIPRIARSENAVATRGNHAPLLHLAPPDSERVGTSGIYVDLDADSSSSDLLTGASKLGDVPGFEFYEVPGAPPGTFFEVFPGSPSITDDGTIAFKGNYSDPVAKTGVYYRELEDKPTGGMAPVQLIANSDTSIPDLPASVDGLTFGSTAPPSADAGQMVFVGLRDEDDPSFGGIYLAPLAQPPELTTLVAIGSDVPGTRGMTFNRLGESLSFDGRFVAFWGAWGGETRTLLLDCPTEGNQARIDFCLDNGFDNAAVEVPLDQGIFVHDIATGRTHMVARTGDGLDDFLFWNFSGRVPGDEAEDDGEPARWRSSAFVAVARRGGTAAKVAFKARTGEIDPNEQNYVDFIDGIYLATSPGRSRITVLDTTTAGSDLDPDAPEGSTVNELGIEREALRGDWLVLTARMGEEGGGHEEGLAGIYVTRVR